MRVFVVANRYTFAFCNPLHTELTCAFLHCLKYLRSSYYLRFVWIYIGGFEELYISYRVRMETDGYLFLLGGAYFKCNSFSPVSLSVKGQHTPRRRKSRIRIFFEGDD